MLRYPGKVHQLLLKHLGTGQERTDPGISGAGDKQRKEGSAADKEEAGGAGAPERWHSEPLGKGLSSPPPSSRLLYR